MQNSTPKPPGEYLQPPPPPPPPSLTPGQAVIDQQSHKDRPSSQLSHNGSSGYGSTRSQLGQTGTSNRPSPDSSTSSSSSSSKAGKRSIWWGQPGKPQFASLRIPNRIRSQGDLPSLVSEEGLDLAEAEIDSIDRSSAERNNNVDEVESPTSKLMPIPNPCYPDYSQSQVCLV